MHLYLPALYFPFRLDTSFSWKLKYPFQYAFPVILISIFQWITLSVQIAYCGVKFSCACVTTFSPLLGEIFVAASLFSLCALEDWCYVLIEISKWQIRYNFSIRFLLYCCRLISTVLNVIILRE